MRNVQKAADLDDLNWAANEDENPRADLGDFNPGDGGDESQITHHSERGRGRVLIKHPTTFLATPEQQAIIDALPIILPGEVLKIQALSGTGKTATLIRLAEAYPELSFLYLAYNADIAKDAAKRFPDNVVVKTTHSLAHGAIDIRSWMNVKRLGNIRRWEMESWLRSRRFDPKLVTGAGLGAVAADVLATVRRFCQSADPAISRRHTWPSDKKTNRDAFRELALRQNPDAKLAEAQGDAAFTRYRDWLAEKAQAVWLAVTNPDDSSLVLEHDVYLKIYQLREPKLDYHVVMVDEFQDTNKCVVSLIMAQKHAVIVVVGDPNQAIYGFRGAMDAMALIAARMSLPLSQSHRFGQAIADQANRILAFKAAHYGGFIPLRGTPTIISTIETLAGPPYTVICRSNRGLFEEALKAVTAGLKINAGAKDLEGAIRYVESCWSLLTGTRIAQMDPDIAEFADGQVLLDEAKSDNSLKWVVKFCQEHVDDLQDICGRLRAAKTRMKKQADVLLTTAHRSKGLEFQHVRLANDFVALDSKLDEAVKAMADRNWTAAENLLRELPVEELHLLYVAATRARVTLQPNQTLALLDTLVPALARLQSKSGYVAPNAEPGGQTADVAASDTEEVRGVWLSFYPEMQAAITDAARYEGWTPAEWVTEVLEVRNLIVASGYSKSFIDDLTALYQKVTVPETSDRTDRIGHF